MKKLVLFLSLVVACGTSHIALAPDGGRTPQGPLIPEECTTLSDLVLDPNAPTAFPVEVLLDNTSTSTHNIGLVLDGIDLWNARMGQEILFATITADVAGMHGRCNYTTVSTNMLLPGDAIGLTMSSHCAADHVDIETLDLHGNDSEAVFFTDPMVTLIATHELGHVLGVPHENDPTSIMYPTLDFTPRFITSHSACLVWLAICHQSVDQ